MTKYAFFEGQIVPIEQAKVSVMTHALHYGTACFAGLRGYWNETEQELFVFRPRDHFRRFLESTQLLGMELPDSVDSLLAKLGELLRTEGFATDCYIRPLAYRGFDALKIAIAGPRRPPVRYVSLRCLSIRRATRRTSCGVTREAARSM